MEARNMANYDNVAFAEDVEIDRQVGDLPSDNWADVNSHTYTYDANLSFKGMTVDVLPDERNYRDVRSLADPSRPTLEELQAGQKVEAARAQADIEAGEEVAAKGKVIKFGWIQGVFMRCLLNIWGVMLFLRLSWVIGQCGIVQGLTVITLCNIVTVITAISMSAVSTNGLIKGGGIYYMISRSLGPEFGGAIGIMFTVANSIAVSTYLIGFCASLLDMLNEYLEDFNGFIGTSEAPINDIRLIGSITLVLILGLAVVGMDWVTRVQIGLLGLLIASQFDFIFGSFIPAEGEGKFGFNGYSFDLLSKNLLETNYHDNVSGEEPSFFTVFGVFFPAVTGIVAGANLSGDLRNPAEAIPKGTLLAIALTYVTYIGYGTMIGAVYLPEASGNETEYQAFLNNDDTIIHFNNCTDRICEFGSSNDQQTLSKISWTGFLVYAGCFAATISSAIASLVGAPRVLQALAKDNLYPFIGFFAPGYGANNDPFRGYILVFFIALGCTMLGSLDSVATLLSNFFVAAYALINFSVFHASITKSPGWRPAFKYYNMWVSLLGTLLCVTVMFLMDWITALITFVIVCVLYFYISYRKPDANWGSSTQAQQFMTTLRNVQTLNESAEHVKNYRPKILVFTGIPGHRPPLVDFASLITKKISLLICGHVITDTTSVKSVQLLKSTVALWLKDHNIKAFYAVTQSNNLEEGAAACMNLAGLGKLSPNMVLLGYKADWQSSKEATESYLGVVHNAFDLHLAIGILRLNHGTDFSHVIASEETRNVENGNNSNGVGASNGGKNKKKEVERHVVYRDKDGAPLKQEVLNDIARFQVKKRKGVIDVWWLYDDGGLTILLPYILTTRYQFKECKLRIFALANKKDELDRETRNMASLLSKFRIDYADVTVIPDVTKKALDSTREQFRQLIENSDIAEAELLAQREKTNRHLRLTELLRQYSLDAEMIVMTLPMPRRGSTSAALYMSWLEMMTRDMPPFLLVRGNQTSVLTFYS